MRIDFGQLSNTYVCKNLKTYITQSYSCTYVIAEFIYLFYLFYLAARLSGIYRFFQEKFAFLS